MSRFKVVFPLRGTWSQTGSIVRDCGPDHSGMEQAARQIALESGNVNAILILY